MNRDTRLKRLLERVEVLADRTQLATVRFEDGSTKQMPLPDVIPLMYADRKPAVVDIKGEGNLAELLRGLL